ncbi:MULTISPECIES: hypothetical protein [Lysinibacillus]|uniref:hypothetical protein n=1 Tax=Lysinibacillus TaxID=400634 RepID=UPI001C8B8C90|nr:MULTISPECIES: hypothetical protein [Lysinibacillus]MBX8943529.1 hypothetical protein [Lysinibacillus sp. K60]UUV27398.1 hypothetical protein NP781_12970 [Lysinibacillus sp. FN11]UYB45672.1 hypothetical protein OCI51_15600 [Lysinibacillus capsici]
MTKEAAERDHTQEEIERILIQNNHETVGRIATDEDTKAEIINFIQKDMYSNTTDQQFIVSLQKLLDPISSCDVTINDSFSDSIICTFKPKEKNSLLMIQKS